MKTTLKSIITVCALVVSGSTLAQNLNSAYFLDGYAYGHEMNPAKEYDRTGYISFPVLGNINMAFRGNVGVKDFFYKNPNGSGLVSYLHPSITSKEAMGAFHDKNKLLMDARIDILSVGFHAFKGYNTITLGSRANIGLNVPYELFDLTKNLTNRNYDISEFGATAIAWGELALGHSHQVNDAWRVGGKVKFLLGGAYAKMKMDNLSLDLSNDNQWIANANATKDDTPSAAYYRSTLYVDLLTENTLNWHLDFGKHKLDLLAGYTAEKTRVQRVSLEATGFPTDDIHTLNAATIFELASSNNGNNAGTGTFRYPDKILESGLARATYSFADKYLLSASVRLDRSSLFLGDNVNAWFPSVSVGWRVSEEPWMKKQSVVNNLKLRASYGVTGNNNVNYFSALEVLGNANYATGTGNGSLVSGAASTSSTLANPDITWEQTDEVNAGLDLGLLRGRISLTLDTYYSITRALLFEQPTQSFTGFSHYWNNIGKVRNSGVEIQLNTVNFTRSHFTWTTDLNFSLTRNKLLEIGGERQNITPGERSENYIARVGDPLIQYYGFKTDGIWNTTEEINANPHFASDVPGGVRIMDTNHDGVLNDDDRVALGNPYPDFSYGMTNTFNWKNWDLSFLIQGVQGVTVFNGDVYYNETFKYNAAYMKTRWVSDSHHGDGRTPYSPKTGFNFLLTDYPLQDASYVCLRNATIGYTFSKDLLRRSFVKGLRLYIAGNNLFYLWSKDYRGINPESRMTSGLYSSPMISGYQRGGFPLTSTVTFGVDVKFK